MPYTTKAALELAFGADEILQLTDRERTGSVDEDVLGAAIAVADGTIDGYLRAGGYTVPIDTDIPVVLVDVANALTRAGLYSHKATEHVAEAKKAALATLRDIQAGKLNPFAAAATPPDIPGTVAYITPDPIYTDDSLVGY